MDYFLIWWVYSFISFATLIVIISMIIVYLYKSSDKWHLSVENDKNQRRTTLKRKILILTIASLIIHFHCGLEIVFNRFLTTFAFYSDLHLNKSIGAYMTSVFWGHLHSIQIFIRIYCRIDWKSNFALGRNYFFISRKCNFTDFR